jgi:hypothetical protein
MKWPMQTGKMIVSTETSVTLTNADSGKTIYWNEYDSSANCEVLLPANPVKGHTQFFLVRASSGSNYLYVRPNLRQVILVPGGNLWIPDTDPEEPWPDFLSYCYSYWYDYMDSTKYEKHRIKMQSVYGIGEIVPIAMYLYYTGLNVSIPYAPVDPEVITQNVEDQLWTNHKLWTPFFWGPHHVSTDDWWSSGTPDESSI